MIIYNINLSDNQIQKIRSAYKKSEPVAIRLSYDQIIRKGTHKILLSETQKKNIDESKRLKKGLVLKLSHEQIKINHSGGFIPLIIAGMGALRTLAGGAAAIANAVKTSQHQAAEEEEQKRHNKEIEKIAQATKSISIGSGIKKNHSDVKQLRY